MGLQFALFFVQANQVREVGGEAVEAIFHAALLRMVEQVIRHTDARLDDLWRIEFSFHDQRIPGLTEYAIEKSRKIYSENH